MAAFRVGCAWILAAVFESRASAMPLYESLKSKFDALNAKYQELAVGGLTLRERFKLLQLGASEIVQICETSPADGAAKKAAAVLAVQSFYAAVIAPLPIPYVPGFLTPFVHKLFSTLLAALIDAAIESAVAIFNQQGWFGPSTST
jgi:hypothetical protein